MRAPHVREADEAVLIGPAPSSESYLLGDKIIDAGEADRSDDPPVRLDSCPSANGSRVRSRTRGSVDSTTG